tara:strand:+ start:4066 stop:5019 length:954 start_codon:yes stop_codon:yes gene_type:complete
MNSKLIELNNKYLIKREQKGINDFSLFNNEKFIDLHKESGRVFYFSLHLISDEKCVGVCNFLEKENGELQSPCAGSYGGFEFVNSINLDIKELFIMKVLKALEAECPKTIKIILPPDIYSLGNNSHIISVLHRDGFKVLNIELNQYIDVARYEINRFVSHGNRKRIKNCLKNGLSFKRLSQNQYHEAYEVIVKNRKKKSFPVTMSWEMLSKMSDTFKEKTLFFGIFDGTKIIASAVCLNVKKNILYVFYWGDLPGYETLSPVALLSYQLTQFAKDNGYDLLDIGTSSVNSLPNLGLYKFKENIGCFSCNKIYLHKTF